MMIAMKTAIATAKTRTTFEYRNSWDIESSVFVSFRFSCG
jgi:hypothetical protein